MRASNEHFQTDYYQKLLSNYNPAKVNLSPAAKQIELDLLRTLPNNKHYDGPHADGIAKLRRVLLAYSVHNPEVEYCQDAIEVAFLFLEAHLFVTASQSQTRCNLGPAAGLFPRPA